MSSNKNHVLVYASDGSHKDLCKFCKVKPCRCRKPEEVKPKQTTIKIRLEKNGRGGKAVTVLFQLPNNVDYCEELCKKLKSHCGSGGTYKNETIEIQGDHRVKVKSYLEKLEFTVKLSGG